MNLVPFRSANGILAFYTIHTIKAASFPDAIQRTVTASYPMLYSVFHSHCFSPFPFFISPCIVNTMQSRERKCSSSILYMHIPVAALPLLPLHATFALSPRFIFIFLLFLVSLPIFLSPRVNMSC